MKTKLEKEVRLLKVYAIVTTLLIGMFVLTAFTLQNRKQNFEEITAKRIVIVDSNGKSRVLMGADLKGANLGGLLFFNEEGTEAGGLLYNGQRDGHGNIDAGALLTMDLFKSDEVIRLGYDHIGDQKRHGLRTSGRRVIECSREGSTVSQVGGRTAGTQIVPSECLPERSSRGACLRAGTSRAHRL